MSDLIEKESEQTEKANSVVSQLWLGVAGNTIYDFLKFLFFGFLVLATAVLYFIRGFDLSVQIIIFLNLLNLFAVGLQSVLPFFKKRRDGNIRSIHPEPVITEKEHLKILSDSDLKKRADIDLINERNERLVERMKLDFDRDFKQLEIPLNKIDFLLEPVKKQSENISSYVEVSIIEISVQNFRDESSFLKIVFVLTVFNKSFFDINFENSVEGVIKYQDEFLLEKKKFFEDPPLIKSLETGFVRVEQRLSRAEVNTIESAAKRYLDQCQNHRGHGIPIPPEFDFSKLILIIKGSKKFPQVLPDELNLIGKKLIFKIQTL